MSYTKNGMTYPISIKIQYPDILIYYNSDCGGFLIQNLKDAFKSICTENDDQDIPIPDDFITDASITGNFGYRSAALYTDGGLDITPTATPVQQPTPAPATGWVYSFITYGSECDTVSSPFARGYSVDACLTSIDQSWKYSCDSG